MATPKNELQEYFQKLGLQLPRYFTVLASPQPNMKWKSTVTIPTGVDTGEHHFVGAAVKSKTGAELSAATKALEFLGLVETKISDFKKELNNSVIDHLQYTGKSKGRLTGKTTGAHHLEKVTTDRFIKHLTNPTRLDYSNPRFIHEGGSGSTSTTQPLSNFPPSKPSWKTLTRRTVLLIDVENIPKIINDVVDMLTPKGINNFWVYAFVGEHTPQALGMKSLSITQHNITIIESPSTRKDGTDTCIQLYTGMFLLDESYDEYLVCTRDNFGGTLVEFIQATDLKWVPKHATLVSNMDHIIKTLNAIGCYE